MGSEDENEERQLPNYDLPVPKANTNLEVYEPNEQKSKPKLEEDKMLYAESWERLQQKHEDVDLSNPLILGKGKKSEKDDEKELKLTYKQKSPDNPLLDNTEGKGKGIP